MVGIQQMVFLNNKLSRTVKAFKNTKPGSFISFIYKLLKQKPFYYVHLRIMICDFLRLAYLRSRNIQKSSGTDFPHKSNSEHLEAAMEWLCYAQDINRDGGIAGSYSFKKGWGASYPEITGYIIPTFFNYYHFSGQKKYRERAVKMVNWLISIQLPNGAFQMFSIGQPPEPRVFNTGQILLGLIKAYKETADERNIGSAKKAADWLVELQNKDGSWKRFSYNGIPHTYHTRVAWPLLEFYRLTGDELYKQSAIKNLRWAINNQAGNGWYKYNSFSKELNPYTHNIVYAARGFFESGVLLGESSYIDSAEKVARVLFGKFEIDKFLPGDFNEGWKSFSGYSCLTGNAQLSILLMRLYELRGDGRYLNTALKINEYLKSTQILNIRNLRIKGGIKGSDPIWGEYKSYSYPSWAAKFFADALLLEKRIKRKQDQVSNEI